MRVTYDTTTDTLTVILRDGVPVRGPVDLNCGGQRLGAGVGRALEQAEGYVEALGTPQADLLARMRRR
jgi:hypothetical protein